MSNNETQGGVQLSTINWYPGHMTKAMRMMEESSKLVDCFIYVLDCRAIYASQNPSFEAIIKKKPVLYVVAKADMVQKSDIDIWTRKLSEEGKNFVITDATATKGKKEIIAKLLKINEEILAKNAAKGINKSIRAMVIGVPNCGKSTLINSLCGGKKTVTGDKAGVTRGKQWVVIGKGLELLDTPGTLPPNIKDQQAAQRLAMIGSIKDDILNIEELTLSLINYLRQNHLEGFNARYGELEGSDVEVLEKIAVSRGFIFKRGVVDYERAARAILDDFRKRRIGKIMLEKPANI